MYLKVTLYPLGKKYKSFSKELLLDYTNCLYQTILDKDQIQNSPSAHNVWSLIENQDLSATTNRIDVGGLWSSRPALFSARGSCSWTQNTYLLNGLDVSDPYWTGKPLFFPDFFGLSFSQLINAGHPPEAVSPGGYFNLLTREETSQYHGGGSVFWLNKKLQSTNISPALEKEGITDSHSFNYYFDGNFHLSGPLINDKLLFFSSLTTYHLSRDTADFEKDDKASLYSGLLSLKYILPKSTLRFLWTGQIITQPSFGAQRYVPFSSTLRRSDYYNIFQLIWDFRYKDNHFLKLGLCLNHGSSNSDFQKGSFDQHGLEIFKNIPQGLAASAGQEKRKAVDFFLKGESLLFNWNKVRQRIQYGFQLRYCTSSSQKEIFDNVQLHFFESQPLEVIKYNTPLNYRESALHLDFFGQDSITFFNFFSLIFGMHLVSSRGWSPHLSSSLSREERNRINWLNISPRIGLILPLSKAKTTALKVWVARYYFTLPLYYLSFGNPEALGGWAYSWQDKNNDRQYEEGEAQVLLRREGPFFSKIDNNLKRPYTDELAISLDHTIGSNWYLRLAGFVRENKNLVETLNIGVPFSSYNSFKIFDIGDDRAAGTADDLNFIVYNQKLETLGQDFFLLTNPDPENRISKYYGLDLTIVKKYSQKFTFFLSLTATSATGTTSPGNTEWENDDGLVGSLYDNPNTLINAKGRMCFDRAYTGRIGFNFLAPFGIRIGCLIKYYDGQPFARKIIVRGMNQGPFYIQAHPRGESRYEYNRTVDIRLEKILHLKKGEIKIILDGFNILNRGLATKENEWTGPEFPLRLATEIQSPRVFRIGLAYEF